MSHEIENELKFLFSKEDFLLLRKKYPLHSTPVQQINYYFALDAQVKPTFPYTLRIRQEENSYVLCLKVRTSPLDAEIVQSKEYSSKLTENQFLAIKKDPPSLLKYFPVEAQHILNPSDATRPPFRLLGSITNTREMRSGPAGFLFTFDVSQFPDQTITYELEIENVSSADVPTILSEIQQYELPYTKSTRGKFQRFLDSIA